MGLYIGVMSGTSMDAVDCALVGWSDETPRLVARHTAPWPPSLRERLQTVAAGSPITATAFGRLDTAVGHFIAETVNALLTDSGYRADDITAIGSHGQTVAHAPDGDEPTSIQLGDANVIAERTKITTVSDFRRRDIAAGGQGAPLAPAFHNAMLRSPDEDRVVLNLGGIANITVLPADTEASVLGFDTGPANCLMDLWVRQHLGKPFDEGGRWAASARPDAVLLDRLLDDPFFRRPSPKSTGTQHFSRQWLQKRLGEFGSPEPGAVQATLLALTVGTVADAIERYAGDCKRVLACGGGTHNIAMIAQLEARLDRPVESTADFGIDPQWVEPMAFAWMARQTLDGLVSSLVSVTGASGPRILGSAHPV